MMKQCLAAAATACMYTEAELTRIKLTAMRGLAPTEGFGASPGKAGHFVDLSVSACRRQAGCLQLLASDTLLQHTMVGGGQDFL